MNMNEKHLVVNNLLINYFFFEGKDRSEKTVVFLHGWRAAGRIWGPVMRTLQDQGKYNLYALDLPGFGKTEMPRKDFTLDDYVEVVAEFINKFILTPPSIPPPQGEGRRREEIILLGHSFGGRIAIKLAADHPELIQKLVLVDSGGIRAEPKFKSLKNGLAKILKPIFALSFLKPLRAKLYRMIGAEDYVATPELKQTFLNIVKEDLTSFLRQINIPTLIVWGENDKEVRVTFGHKMHFLIPNSKFIILPGAGHFSFLDKTEEFVEELERFISFNA